MITQTLIQMPATTHCLVLKNLATNLVHQGVPSIGVVELPHVLKSYSENPDFLMGANAILASAIGVTANK